MEPEDPHYFDGWVLEPVFEDALTAVQNDRAVWLKLTRYFSVIREELKTHGGTRLPHIYLRPNDAWYRDNLASIYRENRWNPHADQTVCVKIASYFRHIFVELERPEWNV